MKEAEGQPPYWEEVGNDRFGKMQVAVWGDIAKCTVPEALQRLSGDEKQELRCIPAGT